MAHIGMASVPAPGHVQPTVEILRRLVARGHRVSYLNDPSFREVVEATGSTLVPYRSVLPATNHAGAGDDDAEDYTGDVIDHLTLFQDEFEAMLPAAHDAFGRDRPDVVLHDIAGVAARIAAEVRGISTLQLSPTYVAWDGYEQDMAELVELLATDPRGKALSARRQAMLDAHGIVADGDGYVGRPERGLVLVPESLQPHADRVDRSVFTFVGPAVRAPDPDAGWSPPPERGVVLVSLGTAFTRHPEFYRRCLEALAGPGRHLVLQIGRHVTTDEVTGGGPVPDGVEIRSWVPQREILEHADAFVTHAGMGGSNEGLVTATPMIAVPQDVDQFANADALVAAGVAVRLDSDTATVADLAGALATVTAPEVRARSRELADDVARGGGAARAVEIIEAMVG